MIWGQESAVRDQRPGAGAPPAVSDQGWFAKDRLLAVGRWSLVRYPAHTVAALAAGFALRYWLWLDQGRAGVVLPGDSDEYYLGAIHLWLQGDYYDTGQWLRPPLTSIFYALAFLLLGPNIPGALLLQCGLSALTALLIGATARSIWRSQRAGSAAMWAAALYLPFAVYASLLLSETIFIFTVALAFSLFEVARRRAMRGTALLIGGGVAFGLAALARPVGLYAVPLLGVWAYLQTRSWRAATRALLLLGLGCGLVVLPWTVRNYLVYRQLVLVDTNGGVSFWFGTIDEPGEERMQVIWNTTLPNSALRQQAALRAGIENIRHDPWRYIRHMRNKTVTLWQPETRQFAGNDVTGTTLPQRSLLFSLAADAQYLLVMALGIAGIVASDGRERNWAVLLWPCYGTLLSALTLGHARLRLPLMITLLIYAALPLAHPGETIRRLRGGRRRLLLAAGLLMLAYLSFSSAFVPLLQGQLRALGGDLRSLQAAQQADPGGFLPALQQARLLRRQGDHAGAADAYRRAAVINPRSIEAQLALLSRARDTNDSAAIARVQTALATAGLDNNLTYRWAWQNEPYAARDRLDLGTTADIGAMHGFSPAAGEKGQSVRYTTMPWAGVRLRTETATELAVRARGASRPVPLRLLVAGREVWHGTVDGWQELQVPLASPVRGEIVVEIVAPVTVQSIQQPYPSGVAIDWIALR